MRPCRVSFRLVSRRFKCFSFTIGCWCSYDDVMLFPDGVFDELEHDDDDEPTTKCTGSKYSVHESLLFVEFEFEFVFTVVVVAAAVEFDI